MAVTAVPGYRARAVPRQHECCRPKKADEVDGSVHAATGFLAGLGLGIVTHAGMHLHGGAAGMAAGQDVLFGLVAAGMALLPDADHPKASFARAAGGLSHGVSHLVAVLTGGHRQGMHSLAGIAALTLVTASCADWWPNRWSLLGLGILLAVCIAAGLRATGFIRKPFDALAAGSIVAAASVYFIRSDLWWLCLLGMALHVFEDSLTGHGVAIAWPLTSRRFGGDGRQPAGRGEAGRGRPAGRPSPRPVSPASPRASQGPGKPMCLQCWLGECGECNDRGCGCPQREHPARPARRRKAAEPANAAGITVEWTDDKPPF